MSALTGARNTPKQGVDAVTNRLGYPQKGSTIIYQGALVALDAGLLVPASSKAGLKVIGCADLDGTQPSDSTGLADGALTVEAKRGTFRWDNSLSTDAIAAANRGSLCYAVDDHTVALTDGGSGARSVAGCIVDVDSSGVWVETVVLVNGELAPSLALRAGTEGPVIRARFATTANITLSTSGLTVIDGVTPVAGDVALVKNQSTPSQNGLYLVGATAWTRMLNSSGGSLLAEAMGVLVGEGTAGAGTLWSLGSNLTTWTQLAAGVVTLGSVTTTPGAESAHAIDVVGAVLTNLGAAAGTTELMIETLSVTDGQGDLAAASSAVGTLNKANNPATGLNVAHMTTTSGGLFSFKVTDTAAEVCAVKITAEGCRPKVIKLTFAG